MAVDDPLPTVTVTASPVPVTWKEAAMVPVGGLSSAGPAGSNSKIVAVRGVWLRGSSDYHLLRDYRDNNRALVSEVTATTGASWFTGSVQRTATATNLFFDVWHFGPNGGSLRGGPSAEIPARRWMNNSAPWLLSIIIDVPW